MSNMVLLNTSILVKKLSKIISLSTIELQIKNTWILTSADNRFKKKTILYVKNHKCFQQFVIISMQNEDSLFTYTIDR